MTESTPQRIVVGIDGSLAAASALRFATDLAHDEDSSILAVHATETTSPPSDAEQHALIDAWVRLSGHTGISATTRWLDSDPRLIVDLASREGADLLVLGRTGSGSGPGFLHLGSVAEYAPHHARVPIAVVPPHVAGPPGRIVLGVDGSPGSAAAVNWCAEHAATLNADVVAVAVEEPHLVQSATSDEWRDAVEQEIAEWTAPISATGVSVRRIVKRDLHPADGLLGVASAHFGDLLVVGMRGAGGFDGLHVGGVAMKILHRAAIPVVLVPPPTASRE